MEGAWAGGGVTADSGAGEQEVDSRSRSPPSLVTEMTPQPRPPPGLLPDVGQQETKDAVLVLADLMGSVVLTQY